MAVVIKLGNIIQHAVDFIAFCLFDLMSPLLVISRSLLLEI